VEDGANVRYELTMTKILQIMIDRGLIDVSTIVGLPCRQCHPSRRSWGRIDAQELLRGHTIPLETRIFESPDLLDYPVSTAIRTSLTNQHATLSNV